MCKLIFRIIITCLCMIMTSSVFAAQRAIISDGWYKIVPVHVQSKALDSAGAGKNAGTNLQIWDFVDAPQQKFYVQHRGNGWYSFKAGHCDLYVDAQGGVPRRGENVWLYTWNGTDAQLWGLYNAGDGYYIETKMQSNLVFDCAGAGRNNGNNVQLWSKENVGWHKWKFVRVSPPQSQTQPQSAEKYVVSTNGATLALRSGPSTNYGIKARMPRGSVVEVYSISNGWANLSYNGTRGYASVAYLRKQGNIEPEYTSQQREYTTREIALTSSRQVVDTFNGVEAIYSKNYTAPGDATYNCAALVKKYYAKHYGVTPYNLLPGRRPVVNGRSLNKVTSPKIGDIVGIKTSSGVNGHWAIVKDVNGNQVTLFEQNWKYNGKTKVNRKIDISSANYYRL